VSDSFKTTLKPGSDVRPGDVLAIEVAALKPGDMLVITRRTFWRVLEVVPYVGKLAHIMSHVAVTDGGGISLERGELVEVLA
jgi:hypothetical protein